VDLPEAEKVGSYVLDRELGRGGMGAVYAAVHQLLGRRAAVKLLLPDLSRKQDLVQRFFNEARAASQIKHPGIVDVYDYGYSGDGTAFIVMELLEGETLAARLKARGRMPIPQAAVLARQVANALAAAHAGGIVHRDLKPDNIFLVKDPEVVGGERVKLLDFGIAKLATEIQGGTSRTVTGAILGTPHYMSPEQCEGAREVDARSDLYSLGCMLFQMVSGVLPFDSPGVGGLIGMHLHVPPPLLRVKCPWASPELEAVVARLLAKNPEDRFPSAEALATVLAAPAVSLVVDVPDFGRAATELAVAPTIATAKGSQGGERSTTEIDRAGRAETMMSDAALVLPPVTGDGATVHATGRRGDATRGDATIPDANATPTVKQAPAGGPTASTRGGKRPIVIVMMMVVVVGGVVLALSVPREEEQPVATDTAVVKQDKGAKDVVTRVEIETPRDAAVPVAPPPGEVHDEVAAETLLKAIQVAAKNADFETVLALHEQVQEATEDAALRAQADELLAKVKGKAVAAAQRKVMTALNRNDCRAAETVMRTTAAKLGDDSLEKFRPALEKCTKAVAADADRKALADDLAKQEDELRKAYSESRWQDASMACGGLVFRKPALVTMCLQVACEANFKGQFQHWLMSVPAHQRDAAERLCPKFAIPKPAPVPPPPANAPNPAPTLPPKKGD
jgi:tRNA A-37 threonylcarbamoyl transferase component Bud32